MANVSFSTPYSAMSLAIPFTHAFSTTSCESRADSRGMPYEGCTPASQGIRRAVSAGVPPPIKCGSPFRAMKTAWYSEARMGVVT